MCAHCLGVGGRVRQVGPRSPCYDVTLGRTGPGHVSASQSEACDLSCSRNDPVFRTGAERKRLRFRIASCVALKLFCASKAFRCFKYHMNEFPSNWQCAGNGKFSIHPHSSFCICNFHAFLFNQSYTFEDCEKRSTTTVPHCRHASC